jgi:hypothetical protein
MFLDRMNHGAGVGSGIHPAMDRGGEHRADRHDAGDPHRHREFSGQYAAAGRQDHAPPERWLADAVHRGTPEYTAHAQGAHRSTPASQPTQVHQSTPNLPAQQPTRVHPGVPIPNDVAVRLLSLLPDLERMVARERDRQRLLSTPVGTPRHTVKKTYVVDSLYVDLIDHYAQAEGVELKDVVNLAFHEFFERRDYLPNKEV